MDLTVQEAVEVTSIRCIIQFSAKVILEICRSSIFFKYVFLPFIRRSAIHLFAEKLGNVTLYRSLNARLKLTRPQHDEVEPNLKKFSTPTEYGVWKLILCSFTYQSQKNLFP